MSTSLKYEDVQEILAKWKASEGPTAEEQATFQENIINELQDPEKLKEYQANIEKVGVWANQVDASFATVTRGLKDMVDKNGDKFPELAGFSNEWNGYSAVGFPSSPWVTMGANIYWFNVAMDCATQPLARCRVSAGYDSQAYVYIVALVTVVISLTAGAPRL